MIELVRRAVEIDEQINELKALYREQDQILAKMLDVGFTNTVVDGYLVTLVDNYVEKNIQFKTVGFRRYEIQVVQL